MLLKESFKDDMLKVMLASAFFSIMVDYRENGL